VVAAIWVEIVADLSVWKATVDLSSKTTDAGANPGIDPSSIMQRPNGSPVMSRI
jgi:hypothetical protein